MFSGLIVAMALVGQCNGGSCMMGGGCSDGSCMMGGCSNGSCMMGGYGESYRYMDDDYVAPQPQIIYKNCEGVTSRSYIVCQFTKDFRMNTPVLNGILPRPTVGRYRNGSVARVTLDYGQGFTLNECSAEADGSIKYRTKEEMAEYKAGQGAAQRQTSVAPQQPVTTKPPFVPPTPAPPVPISTKTATIPQVGNEELMQAIRELDGKIQGVDKKLQRMDQLEARVQALEERTPAKVKTEPTTPTKAPPVPAMVPDLKPSEVPEK